MLRWPYKFRKPEGVNKGIPGVRALWYKWDVLMENCFIRLSRLPKKGLYDGKDRQIKVIVSLTSFPARIDKVYYAIKSLMIQKEKADEIQLWLAEEQFPQRIIPKKLEKLVSRGLTIKWCDDKRSHKKYFYTLQEQKENEVVITYDDDLIYEKDSITKLLNAHKKFPDCIICNRGHEILRDEKGEMLPYSQWKIHSKVGVNEPAMDILPSTGNGCLYPYGCMPKITFKWETIKELALTADDLWIRFCSYSNCVKVVKTKETIATLCVVYGSQKERLTLLNDINGENQKVIYRIKEQFPNVYNNCK